MRVPVLTQKECGAGDGTAAGTAVPKLVLKTSINRSWLKSAWAKPIQKPGVLKPMAAEATLLKVLLPLLTKISFARSGPWDWPSRAGVRWRRRRPN